MEIFRSGKWSVTSEGIKWDGQPAAFISRESIGEHGGRGGRRKMHDWLVHMAGRTFLTEEDILALNTAYIFALEYFGKGFSPEISWVATFLEQKRVFNKRVEGAEFDELTIGGGG